MTYSLSVVKRQRYTPPSITTSTSGGQFIAYHTTSTTTGTFYYAIHVFYSSGQFTLTNFISSTDLEIVAVAGGGGGGAGTFLAGGSTAGGGGGAGGVTSTSLLSFTGGSTLSIVIGAGGLAASSSQRGGTGNNTTISSSSITTITAYGGGGGGSYIGNSDTVYVGGDGGSGGGGTRSSTNIAGAGGNSVLGQGFNGGSGLSGSGSTLAGSGGGAGSSGAAGGNGGIGRSITISGTIQYYGGGGGSSDAVGAGVRTDGGLGGGGYGFDTLTPSLPSTNGTPNTGGGGGGGYYESGGTVGSGGSGVVIIRYQIPQKFYADRQADPYFKNNALVLKATSSTYTTYIANSPFIVDYSSATSILGIVDAVANTRGPFPTSTSTYNSVYFNGSTSYLTIPNFAGITFQSNDFTIECWIYPTVLGGQNGIYGKRNVLEYIGVVFRIFNTTSKLVMQIANATGSAWAIDAPNDPLMPAVSINTWQHVALVRTGSFFKMFLNGQGGTTYNYSGAIADNTSLGNIGRSDGIGGNQYFNGYISNFRIVKGVGVYTGNFSVSTTGLNTTTIATTNVQAVTNSTQVLAAKFITFYTSYITYSTSVVDYSTNTFAISILGSVSPNTLSPYVSTSTNNSLQFVGANQRLSIAASSAFDLSGGNWTIEFWMYSTATPTTLQCRIFLFGTNQTTTGFVVGYNNDGSIAANIPIAIPYVPVNPIVAITAAGVITLNKWYHVAVVSNAGTAAIYINGIQSGSSVTLTQPLSSSPTLNIGYDTVNTVNFQYQGYLSNIRIVKGTPVYTGIFTPPSGPLNPTQIANPFGGTNTNAILSSTSTSLLIGKFTTALYPSGLNFNDYSYAGNLVSFAGTPTQSTFSPFGNNWSTFFNGSTDLLTIADTSTFYFNSDFTIESWLYPVTSLSSSYIIGQTTTTNYAPVLAWISNNAPALSMSINQVAVAWSINIVSPTALSLNQWSHVAWVRAGNTYSIYSNGVLQISGTTGLSTYDSTAPMRIGAGNLLTNLYNGYISNLRIVNGTALYNTSTYVVPASPLSIINNTVLLIAAGNRHVDKSNYNLAISTASSTISVTKFSPFTIPGEYNTTMVGASANFNGSTDSLSITPGQLGTLDFTIDLWFYITPTIGIVNGLRDLFDMRTTNTENLGFDLYLTAANNLVFTSVTTVYITGATIVNYNTWNHVSVIRYSNVFRMFLNGAPEGPPYFGSVTQNFTNTIVRIGKGVQTGFFNGYITNVRLIKGRAIYPIYINAPTSTLTAVTGTQLLVTTNTLFNDVGGTSVTVYRSGNPIRTTTLSPFVSGGSAYFNGINNYITLTTGTNNATAFTFGDNNFTIEAWVYPMSRNSYGSIIIGPTTYGGTTNWLFMINPTGYLYFQLGPLVGTSITSSATVPLNVWSHVSLVKSNSVYTFYINGRTSGYGTITSADTSLAFAAGSLYFNGSSYVSYPTNAAWALGAGPFTVECWFYQTAYPSANQAGSLIYLWHSGPGRSFAMYASYNGVGGIGASWNTSGGMSGGPATNLNTWYHAAFVSNGVNFFLYLNGQQVATAAAVTLAASTDPLFIGANNDAGSPTWFFRGYITNVRIVKGTSLYNGTFTPSVPLTNVSGSSLLLLVNNDTDKALDSANNFTPTVSGATFSSSIVPSVVLYLNYTSAAGALSFNGSNYLGATKTGGWLSSGDHTVEAWIYITTLPNPTDANQYIRAACIAGEGNGTNTGAWEFWIQPNTIAVGYKLLSTNTFIGGSYTFSILTWYHVAFSRSGTTVRVYVNGIEVANGTISSWTAQTVLNIGRNGVTSFYYPFYGYITNFRIVNAAVYTANFTPAVPLLNIANTVLLLLVNSDANKLVDSSSNAYTITNNSSVTYQNSNLPTVLAASSNYISNTIPVGIGGAINGISTTLFNGYISNLHVMNNYVKYLADFTPSTTDVTTASNSVFLSFLSNTATIIDSSISAFNITNVNTTTMQAMSPFAPEWSTYFDGSSYLNYDHNNNLNLAGGPWTAEGWFWPTGNYNRLTTLFAKRNADPTGSVLYYSVLFDNVNSLTTPANSNFGISGTDFTFEAWIYVTSLAHEAYIVVVGTYGSAIYWAFVINANGTLSVWGSNTGAWTQQWIYTTSAVSGTGQVPLNIWTHVSVVRYTSSSLNIYINGVSQFFASSFNTGTGVPSVTNAVWLGSYFTVADTAFNGYMSNVRFVRQAVYTGNFVPPTITLSGSQLSNPSGGTNTQAIIDPTNTILNTLRFNGVSPSILDYTTYGNTISNPGPLSVSTQRPIFYGSIYFNGTNQYLSLPVGTSSFGTGDFTMEAWIYPTTVGSGPGSEIFDFWATGASGSYTVGQFQLQLNSVGTLTFYYATANNAFSNVTTPTAINLNVWTHVAVVRSISVLTIYINGSASGIGTVTQKLASVIGSIGRQTYSNTYFFKGFISNARIVSGQAVYTSNFTIPYAPLSNTQTVSVSGVPSTAILPSTNSLLFNGTSQYLTIPASSSFAIGVNDFTIEAWVYPFTYGSGPGAEILDFWTTGGSGSYTVGQPQLQLNSAGTVGFYYATANNAYSSVITTATVPLNAWTHVAVVRQGTTLIIYLNGVNSASGTVTQSLETTLGGSIGRQTYSNTYFFNGFISNARIVNNMAVYRGAFTPPTTALSVAQSTGTNINSISAYAVLFGGGKYMPTGAYRYSSQYLTVRNTTDFQFGTGDFTIECWAYIINYQSGGLTDNGIFHLDTSYFPNRAGGLAVGALNSIWYVFYGATSSVAVGSLASAQNVWYHIALVRRSGVLSLYINGVGAVAVASDVTNYAHTNLVIGGYASSVYTTSGYISNFRMVKGVAVYSGNFTVPSTGLTKIQSSGTNISAITQINSTVLLTINSSTIVDSSFINNTIGNGGAVINPVAAPVSPFNTGTGTVTLLTGQSDNQRIPMSLYFDGSSFLSLSGDVGKYNTSMTVEAWVYPTQYPGALGHIFYVGTNANNIGFSVGLNGSQPAFTKNGSFPWYGTANAIPLNTWTHLAVIIDTSVNMDVAMFINGSLHAFDFGYTIPTSVVGDYACIGGNQNSQNFYGFISNLRVVRDTVVYTGSNIGFRTPVLPLPQSTGTSLLLAVNTSTSYLVDQSTASTYIAAVGTVSYSTLTPFVTGGSLYFNQSTQYLSIPNNAVFNLGSNFTIEAWIYLNSTGVPQQIIGTYPSGFSSPGTSYEFLLSSGNFLQFDTFIGTSNQTVTATNNPLVANVIYHVAAVRIDGGTVNLYVNGNLCTVNGTLSQDVSSGGYTITIGRSLYTPYNHQLSGSIYNLRVVKGLGVYTSNFNPPSILATTQLRDTNIQAISTASYTSLLLNINSLASYITDSSTYTLTLTNVGTVSYRPLYGSIFFNSGYLDISVGAVTNLTSGASGNYTIECWVYQTAAPTGTTYSTANPILSGYSINTSPYIIHLWAITSTGYLFKTRNSAAGYVVVTAATPSLNTWAHIAFSNIGATTSIFLNGVIVGQGDTAVGNWNVNSESAAIGYNGGNALTATVPVYFPGYITNIRVTSGTALYAAPTANPIFTPPTRPLTSTSTANPFGGLNTVAITGTSTTALIGLYTNDTIKDESPVPSIVYYNGLVTMSTVRTPPISNTSTYIVDNGINKFNLLNNTAVTTGTNNPLSGATTLLIGKFLGTSSNIVSDSINNPSISIVNGTTATTQSPFVSTTSTGTIAYQAYISSSTGYLGFYNGTVYSTSTTRLTTGTWNHCAWVYDDGGGIISPNLGMYVNGNRIFYSTSTSSVTLIDNLYNFYIGGIANSSEYYYGSISNFRIVKGSSLYLGSFVGIPTSKLSTVTNTVVRPYTSTINTALLTLQDYLFKDNSVNNINVSAIGNLKTQPYSPFVGDSLTRSIQFTANNDYLLYTSPSANASLALGNSNFTVECWIYITAYNANTSNIIDWRGNVAGATAGVPVLVLTAAGNLAWQNTGGTAVITANTTIPLGVWYHISVVRSGTAITMYYNGALVGYYTDAPTTLTIHSSGLSVNSAYTATNYLLYGYISNVRITKGQAVYTIPNFAPSTVPLNPVAGSNLFLPFTDTKIVDYTGNTAGKPGSNTFLVSNTVIRYNTYNMYFNGTTDFIRIPYSTAYAFSTGDFTAEMWIYPTSGSWSASSGYVSDFFDLTGAAIGVLRYANNMIRYYDTQVGSSLTAYNSYAAISPNVWTHVALSRDNGTIRVFLNGIAATSQTATAYNFTASSPSIGWNQQSGVNAYQGYIDDIRITKGIARYKSSFVPPLKLPNR